MPRLLSLSLLAALATVSHAAPSASACTNTFTNGGFESGLSNWAKITQGPGFSTVKVVAPGINSKHAARMFLGAQDGEGYVGLAQDGYSLCPGNYNLDLDFKVVASDTDGVALQAIFDNDENQTYYVYNSVGGSGTKQHYTLGFTATKKNQHDHGLEFFAHNYNAMANITITIDNVMITKATS